MNRGVALRIVVLSFAALLLELALIRWLGSEVRIFAYYKNLVLIACFVGFGLGFARSDRPPRLGASVAAVVAIVLVVSFSASRGWRFGPALASSALSHFEDSFTMHDAQSTAANLNGFLLGIGWTTALFLACQVALFGYAQSIGAGIAALGPERRLLAYSLNVAGSLAGVLAFALASWLELPPLAWFFAAVAATAPCLPGAGPQAFALLGGGVLAAVLLPAPNVTWSPYQKLEYVPHHGWGVVMVNNDGYMALASVPPSLHEARPPFLAFGLDRWRLPHAVFPGARNVLVIGAGGGNDVSAALVAGAGRVVAVEIDPAIHRIGRAHHPDQPYQSPRVEVVIDDARHYAETATERFDLIVFSHLDAHEALSSYTNVRLDNYVHTTESFRTFRRLLRKGGALYVSFLAVKPWVAARLRENLREAFGVPPATLILAPEPKYAHFFASEDGALLARARDYAPALFRDVDASVPPTAPSTDDWPFLYVERRRVPSPILWITLPIALASALAVVAVAGGLGRGRRLRIDRHFFFLGAAFLLLEVHNVGKLARVFGTTWSVNAWVISGVLAVALLANALAGLVRGWRGIAIVYAVLVALLTALPFVPIERVLALAGGEVVAVALYTFPLFFASLVFARSFRDVGEPERALASNILGAVLGGFLEAASFVVGLPALLWIAAGLYVLSYPRSDRSEA